MFELVSMKWSSKMRSLRHVSAFVVVSATGIFLATLSYWLSFGYFESERVHHEYEEPAGQQARVIDRAIATHIEVVHSISSLYAASPEVGRGEFRAFVEHSMRISPGIQALEWIPRVSKARRAEYEARARDRGLEAFRFTEMSSSGELTTAAPRDEYFPVYFIEPIKGNERALGFDLASNPARREALVQARDTGRAVATQRITLVQEDGGQFGFLVFVPVYQGGVVPATADRRRDKLQGFALGVFRIGDIVEAALDAANMPHEFMIAMFDTEARPDERLLYISGGSLDDVLIESTDNSEILADAAFSSTLLVAGREWRIRFQPVPGGTSRWFHAESAWLAAIVVALTMLLLVYLGRSHKHTEEIEHLVARRSHELMEINATLKTEIIERKRVQHQLTQTQKMEAIGQLTGGIAHDFNNLLMIVDGYTRKAVSKLDNREIVETSLLQVLSATDKASNLTKQLLSFSRRQFTETRVVRVSNVIREVEGLIETLVGEQAEVEYHVVSDDICVNTDPSELSQAVVNLAINARDAITNSGKVLIGVRLADLDESFTEGRANIEPGRFAEVYVEDDGTGIDEDTLAHVFEPFFTTKEQGAGTGLGLAMVYGFAQQSGGAAEVSSVLGEGTTVSIFLPITDLAPDAVRATADVLHRGQGETVLVVEDDEALLDLTSSMIEDLGYAVLKAANGMDALEVDEDFENPIDLMLSDVVMPAMDGFELAAIIRQRRPDMKIMFMSGYPRSMDSDRDESVDKAQMLQKPIKEIALARFIRQELDGVEISANG